MGLATIDPHSRHIKRADQGLQKKKKTGLV